MKSVVITGSTRGIGYGLADAFLGLGCAVVVSGRSQARVEQAAEALSEKHDPAAILTHACDVTVFEQVQALWDAAAGHFGKVDIWINNAGVSNIYRPAWEQTPAQMAAVVRTNLLGTMYGTKVAFLGMRAQGFGQIYNMEGSGSNGRLQAGLTDYGTTKRAVRFFTCSFINELDDDTPVLVGRLSPGMIVTDLLVDAYEDPADFERSKPIFNIFCDRVETVTPWLARHILANQKNDAHFRWLTRGKLYWRFLTAPFVKRDVFTGYEAGGRRVQSQDS